MPGLKYAEFYTELIGNMRLKPRDVPGFIRERTKEECGYGCEVTLEQVYEFLKGRSRPSSETASIWEFAFGVHLAPHYYGYGSRFKPGKLPL